MFSMEHIIYIIVESQLYVLPLFFLSKKISSDKQYYFTQIFLKYLNKLDF